MPRADRNFLRRKLLRQRVEIQVVQPLAIATDKDDTAIDLGRDLRRRAFRGVRHRVDGLRLQDVA
jgi:hypothetical protein